MDGSQFAFTARSPGTNFVYYVYVFNAAQGTSLKYKAQTDATPALSGDGTFVAFNRYQYLYSGDLGILKLESNSYYYTTTLDEVGGRAPAVPSVGRCALTTSYSPNGLTSDLPNRGLWVAYNDLFIYNVDQDSWFRVTNSYTHGVEGGVWGPAYAVADNCHGVLFAAPPDALSKTSKLTQPIDVYFTDLSVLPG